MLCVFDVFFCFFFFNDTATTEIYTLSLHDALPIFVERGLARLADRVVAIPDALRAFTIERVGVSAAKVQTIHYGLDGLPAAWGDNPPDDVPQDARVLLAVSRLTQQKGIDVAIRALAELPADTVLVVLGEGGERGALEQL